MNICRAVISRPFMECPCGSRWPSSVHFNDYPSPKAVAVAGVKNMWVSLSVANAALAPIVFFLLLYVRLSSYPTLISVADRYTSINWPQIHYNHLQHRRGHLTFLNRRKKRDQVVCSAIKTGGRHEGGRVHYRSTRCQDFKEIVILKIYRCWKAQLLFIIIDAPC